MPTVKELRKVMRAYKKKKCKPYTGKNVKKSDLLKLIKEYDLYDPKFDKPIKRVNQNPEKQKQIKRQNVAYLLDMQNNLQSVDKQNLALKKQFDDINKSYEQTLKDFKKELGPEVKESVETLKEQIKYLDKQIENVRKLRMRHKNEPYKLNFLQQELDILLTTRKGILEDIKGVGEGFLGPLPAIIKILPILYKINYETPLGPGGLIRIIKKLTGYDLEPRFLKYVIQLLQNFAK